MPKTIQTETPAMTLRELQASLEYRACSDKAQRWITVLIQSNDYTAATEAAFTCKSRRIAQAFSHAIRKWARVRACLNLYHGVSPHEAQLEDARLERIKLLREVKRHLRSSEPGSVASQRLLAQKERLLFGGEPEAETAETETPQTSAPSEAKHRFSVGDIAVLDGKKYRVTATREDGTVGEADPL